MANYTLSQDHFDFNEFGPMNISVTVLSDDPMQDFEVTAIDTNDMNFFRPGVPYTQIASGHNAQLTLSDIGEIFPRTYQYIMQDMKTYGTVSKIVDLPSDFASIIKYTAPMDRSRDYTFNVHIREIPPINGTVIQGTVTIWNNWAVANAAFSQHVVHPDIKARAL